MRTRLIGYALLAIFVICTITSTAQDRTSAIRFVPGKELNDNTKCFNVEVKVNQEGEAKLASQNYRIFYDANRMRFLRENVTSYLKDYAYSGPKVLQAVHNSDASGYGNLEFSSTLGFVNININDIGDLVNLKSMKMGRWEETMALCFEIYESNAPLNMIWGREGITDGYATAFTAISIAVRQNSESTMITEYGDLQEYDEVYQERMANSDIKN